MPETLRVFGDRPAVVTHEGWTVYIGVHDANHVRERSAWKLRLAGAHPDRHPSTPALKLRQERKFRNLKERQEKWLGRETAWYEQFQLEPPPFGKSKPFTRGGTRAAEPLPDPLTVHRWGTHDAALSSRIWRLLEDGQPHPAAAMRDTLAVSEAALYGAIRRLRQRGARIARTRALDGVLWYQLTTPDGYRFPDADGLPQQLAAIFADGQVHPLAELQATFPTVKQHLFTAIHRLIKLGAPIQRVHFNGVYTYQLLPSPTRGAA